MEEDEAEAPAPAVDEDHSDDGFSDGEAHLIEQIVSDADAAAPAPSLSHRTYPPLPTADPEHVKRAHQAAHVALAKVAATAVVLPIFKHVSASVSRGERIDHDPNPDLRERKLLHDDGGPSARSNARCKTSRTAPRRACRPSRAATPSGAARQAPAEEASMPPPPPDPRRRVLRKGRSGFALPAAPSRQGALSVPARDRRRLGEPSTRTTTSRGAGRCCG